MRILLIAPSQLDLHGRLQKYRLAFLPPLSLAVLNSLTPRLHKVTIVNDLVEEIDFQGGYDLVGITCMTSQSGRAYQIADRFRSMGTRVVLGGVHPTVLPDEAKEHADAVVIGEAERTWPEVLADAENRRLKEFYRDRDRPDLDQAPVPRWDEMNLAIYPRRIGTKLPFMPLVTTRGCPYGCKFCSVTSLYGVSYRTKSVSGVLAEIDSVKAEEFLFVDDNIACEPDYSRELFHALRPRNIRWVSQISTTVLKNPDLIGLAARSGCFWLFVGVESLNAGSLSSVNKGFNKVEQYGELVARCRKAGIVPFLSFMFGFDNDTEEDFESTLEFLRKERVGLAAFWILTPLPGTKLAEEFAAQGRIFNRDWSSYDGAHVVFYPRNFTPARLEEKYWEAFRRHFSLRSICSTTLANARASKHPTDEFFRNLFFQPYMRHKVRRRLHPFSGGIGRGGEEQGTSMK